MTTPLVTETTAVSLFNSPRIREIRKDLDFNFSIEAALFEKTGLVAEVDKDNTNRIVFYSDFTKQNALGETIIPPTHILYSRMIEQDLEKDLIDDKNKTSIQECFIPVSKEAIQYNIKGLVHYTPEYYRKASHEKLISRFLANTLFKYTLIKPIVTSDGIKYHSCLNYFQAMRTLDYETRCSISKKHPSDGDVANFWQNIPEVVRKEYLRDDFTQELGLKILYKAFTFAINHDAGFKSLLTVNKYSHLIYFTDVPDLLYTYGVSTDTCFGLNFVGRALMYARYQYLNQSK